MRDVCVCGRGGHGSGGDRLTLLLEKQMKHLFLIQRLLSRPKPLINCNCTVIDFILNKTSNPLGEKQKKVRLAKETEKILFH